jgi:hypothetical protein
MRRYKADHIAITEKDAIKLKELNLDVDSARRILVYPMRLELNNRESFSKLLLSVINK